MSTLNPIAQLTASDGASNIGFLQSGTGATARTVEDKLRDIVSVRDFGAVGDGITNDRPAFALATTANKLAYIPKGAGNYVFNTPLANTSAAFLPDPRLTWANLGSGSLDMSKGAFAVTGASIWRFADRMFVGEAASKWAAVSEALTDAGTSWLSDSSTAAAFTGINATLLVTTTETNSLTGGSGGRYAITGAAKSSASTGSSIIGVSGVVVNQKSGASAWALYADVQEESNGFSTGVEIASKNASANNYTLKPYTYANGTYGVWLAGGGDNAYGPAAANPSNAAIAVVKNATTWNVGLVFRNDALTGTDGSVGSTGIASAITMARQHAIRWHEPTTDTVGAEIWSSVTTSTGRVGLWFTNSQVSTIGPAGQIIGATVAESNAVNYISTTARASTAAPRVDAVGSDTDIDLWLSPKGAGVVRFGSWVSSADSPVNGYVTIKDSSGNIRKLATIA